MEHYTFPDSFRALYEKAVALYGRGVQRADQLFAAEETAFLAAHGLNAQALFDYAEDHHAAGEPGYDRALGIESVRRDYFLTVQRGRPSAQVLDPATLPDPGETLQGIAWLPRILPKARAKLRGELPPSLMYSCGGDRRFFKENDILPAEFLSLIWREGDNDAAIASWVVARSKRP